jgi:cytochrome c oxidase cbb3-type subunit 4
MSSLDYNALRHFADSWGLLSMMGVFLFLIGWALRPGARQHHDDAANSIFRDDHNG